MSWDVDEMAERHKALWLWIAERLQERNIGTFDIPEKSFALLPQARGSFFIIDMYGPDDHVHPVPLVFNFHNLYLAGFEQGNCWYLFDDADLLGSGFDLPESAPFWNYLGFRGGYTGDVFKDLSLGICELEAGYQTLIHYPDYQHGEWRVVQRACMRIMIMLCEAWRFTQWNDRVFEILSGFLSCEVNCPETVINDFSDLFQSWSKLSVRLLLGRDLFHTVPLLPRFLEYAMMIPVIDVLLRATLTD